MNKGRKISGGKYIRNRKKKVSDRLGQKRIVKLGAEKRKIKKVTGGNKKIVLFGAKFVNLQEKGKSKKLEIKNVIETPSNRFLARQNVITKGTIVLTDSGKVKVTNRPTQNGIVNGILIKENK
ncbi:30S ribosomal protein S8e [uncultured archaeon]|nr:30S ribosomal protein S8e [uncultured archaeon]